MPIVVIVGPQSNLFYNSTQIMVCMGERVSDITGFYGVMNSPLKTHLTTSCRLEGITDDISFYATPLSQMVGWGE